MGESESNPTMPYDERNEETGRFSPTFSDESFLDAITSVDPPTTSGIADAVGCKYRTAYERLGQLEDEGRIKRSQVGNSLVWSVLDNGREDL